ncbi:DNA invertase Pin-like site-specific DNA recombinase [Kribbella sp. VKM Ac-2527]|uniref:DNA invertase Pin-like site-specific DNA recombinase n=1 Tax=Kribbella caucasensis TaxID=2512215 RepID=A0A4R6J5C1_9ACTN|nr:recombinase family protein [Kribbella sp. VKM Ac-2527]TDO30227.1 DNA invertase Pin-like site-specific DNA recombinase [Kribbella sp. VKM Ac-2527]
MTTVADLAQLELDGDPIDPIGGGGALIGYARVSTRDQKLHRQVDALTAAGCHRIFEEKLSGKNIDRPELAKCLDYLRPGDTIVVLELWRLGRSLQDLISIVGELRRRGIGFKSLHEALDTTTPGGRLVFHVFAALAEFIRELIVEGTNEGLAAARARGVRLGRPPAMTLEQIQSARTLLTQPENSVSSIAKLLGVSRSTIYKYVPDLTKQPTLPLEAEQQPEAAAIIEAPQPAQPASEPVPTGRGPACPTCDYRPTDSRELELHRDDLATVWLTLDPDDPGRIIERRHCERCQPHRARIVMCGLFDTTVMLGDDLAVPEPSPLPQPAVQWLATNAWRQHDGDWYCGKHTDGAG